MISAGAVQPPPLESITGFGYGAGLGSLVLQPPLPLQEFLPLQPLSPDSQPPCPLQLFFPLQSCLPLSPVSSIWPQLVNAVPFALVVGWLAYVRATAPVIKPAKAAPATNTFVVLFTATPPGC